MHGNRSQCWRIVCSGRDAVERDVSDYVSWRASSGSDDVAVWLQLDVDDVPPLSVRTSVVRRVRRPAPTLRVQSATLELRLRGDAAAAGRSLRLDQVPCRRRRCRGTSGPDVEVGSQCAAAGRRWFARLQDRCASRPRPSANDFQLSSFGCVACVAYRGRAFARDPKGRGVRISAGPLQQPWSGSSHACASVIRQYYLVPDDGR